MKNIFFIVLFAGFFSACFFIFVAQTNTPNIVVTEIGANESAGVEWLELYNTSDTSMNVDGWVFWENQTNHKLSLVQGSSTIAAGEFFIIAQDAEKLRKRYSLTSTTITIFDSSWGSLKESGEEIGIKNSEGEFIEQFSYISLTNFSLEKVDLFVNDYSEQNWKEHPTKNTIGKENFWSKQPLVEEEPQPEDPQENDSGEGVLEGDEEAMNNDHPEQEPLAPEENEDMLVLAFSTILISEVVSNPKEGSEWIELWVSGTSTGKVKNIELFDSVGKIAHVSTTVSSSRYITLDLDSAKLNNAGDIIRVFNEQGGLLDSFAYGDVEGVSTTLKHAQKGQSFIRILTDKSTSSSPFFITHISTKGKKNILQVHDSSVPEVHLPSSGGVHSSPSNIPVQISKYAVLINELVSDPSDDTEEFIELFNTTQENISIDNWWIEDGSEKKTVLEGNIPAGGFVVIKNPKGNLNNAGDRVTLFNQQENIIDVVTYGTWDDENLSDNAPVAKDPFSLSRGINGKNSLNNGLDFFVTSQITPGSKNIIEVLGEKVLNQDATAFAGKIQLSEIFPNPKGSDTQEEFIELFNISDTAIDLKNWKLGDGSKKRFTFTDQVIAANSSLVMFRKDSGISLNNSGEESVHIYAPNGMIIDRVIYSGSVQENHSYIRQDNDTWLWTSMPTPGEKNILHGIAAAPIISLFGSSEGKVNEDILFDASDTTDPGNLNMEFFWNFGDGEKGSGDSIFHRYHEPGIYELLLRVKNSAGASSTKQLFITIHQTDAFIDQQQADKEGLQQQIQISEILPNPKGSDHAEFIELYNPLLVSVELSGMSLDDQEGGSRAYVFPEGSRIAAQEYLVMDRKETGLALNNTGDMVRLFSSEKKLLREIEYEGTVEGASYALDELGMYVWSMTPTAGSINILDEVEESAQPKKTSKQTKKEVPIISTTIAGAKLQDVGDKVEVYGVVTALPGVFGSQYFYISHEHEGIQVYMYKKDFPDLYEGKGVYVIGEISETSGESRIKIKEKTDIRPHDEPGIVYPTSTEISNLDHADYGGLVSLAGEITEVKSSHAYLDDGTEEVKLYFKRGTGISKNSVQVGSLAEVTGVVSQSKGTLVVLPRSDNDIKITGVSQASVIKKEQAEEQKEEAQVQMYLLTTAGGITAILIGLLLRQYGPLLFCFLQKKIPVLNKYKKI